MDNLTFITGSANKAAYVAAWLHHSIKHQSVDVPEIQSLDVREVVGQKAKSAYKIIKNPVLVEDVSMQLPALGNLPGPFVKWFEKAVGLEGVCRMLDGKDRTAIVTCCYGLFDGADIYFFDGVMKGKLADHPQGSRGFGFDPVFINDGYSKTRGEMTEVEYEATSMRKAALSKLSSYIKNLK